MRIDDIKYVLMIDRYKNFSKAAASLHISQPALSQNIQRLELELGCQLFDRQKNGIVLTSSGRIFIEEGEKILNIERSMRNRLGGEDLKSGHVTVGASPMYSKYYFPFTFLEFCRLYPHIELSLEESFNMSMKKRILQGDVDLIITQAMPGESRLVFLPLYQETIVLAVAQEIYERKKKYIYQKDGKEYATVKGFSDEKFVSYTPQNTMSSVTKALCMEAGFEPEIVFQSSNPEVLNALISGGMGVGFLPSLTTLYNILPAEVHYLNLDSPLAVRDYTIAYNKETGLSPACRSFIELSQQMHAREEFHHNYHKTK